MSHTLATPQTTARGAALETMRAVAVLLLVSYHVIGSNAGAGLHLSYPAPMRIFADFLIDVRMPFFAFVAGYVYALRPVTAGRYSKFITGKFRRLYIPGAIASALFAIAATLIASKSAQNPADFWEIFFFPYMHYWFLQAILVIFIFFGALDALLHGRGTVGLFLASCVVFLFDFFVPGNLMSINQAMYLLPFFLLGVVYIRFKPAFLAAAGWLVPVCVMVILAASAINFITLQNTGRMSMDRQDLQSLAMGLSGCMAAIIALPSVPQLEKIGPYAFTIYLYHVFGTAGMRMSLDGLGITSLSFHLILGLVAGIALPIGVHMTAMTTSAGRRWILGKRT